MKAAADAPTIEVLVAERFAAVVPELAELLVDAVATGASIGFLPPFTAVDAERWWWALTDDVVARRVLVQLLRVDGRALATAQLRLAHLPTLGIGRRWRRSSFTAPRGTGVTAECPWTRSKPLRETLAVTCSFSTR